MSRRSRSRKQRVLLRPKERVELKRRLRYAGIAAVILGGIGFLGTQAVSQSSAWAPQFVQRHTPRLELQAPAALVDLALLKESEPGRFGLWFPGMEWRMRARWLRQYPAVREIHFEKHFSENRIVARLEPRVPLARWQDRGVDREGVVFPLGSARWTPLPKAMIVSTQTLPALGRWLAEISNRTDLWSQVVAVSQDQRGEVWLDLGTGTHVAWGAPDIRDAREKARCLALVLNDAHQRLSGATSADARFFEEGRIIIRPKKAIKLEPTIG